MLGFTTRPRSVRETVTHAYKPALKRTTSQGQPGLHSKIDAKREEGGRGRKAGRSQIQKRTKWGKVSSSLVGRGLA